jgi:delta 1-pyrroline-5-carboxylate dehydrogenase
MFREAGFPSGVLNFLLHQPEDAAEIFDTLIKHPAIKKCNFTGSTQVGRVIASQAAMALKPVLLELGGKNFTVVLDDADLDLAAGEIIKGAFLNVSNDSPSHLTPRFMVLTDRKEWANLHVYGLGTRYKVCGTSPRI